MDDNDFWSFSNQIYRKNHISEVCLYLQDIHKLNINLILFCCWFGKNFGVLDKNLFNKIIKRSSSWDVVVVAPLRKLRIDLKYSNKANLNWSAEIPLLREKIKTIELEAEKLNQLYLQKEALKLKKNKISTKQLDCVIKNLFLYLFNKKICFSKSNTNLFNNTMLILIAIFPNHNQEEIANKLDNLKDK